MLTKAKNANVSQIFYLRSHLLQSEAMVAKKLLVDDKITACFKRICLKPIVRV